MNNYINSAPRRKLREFNQYFIQEWHSTIHKLFGELNEECNKLIRKYDSWFNGTLEDINSVLEEKYKNHLRSFKKSKVFYTISIITISIVTLITFLSNNNIENFVLNSSIISISFSALLIPLFWRIYCLTKKESPLPVQQIKVLDVVPFKISEDSDFRASNELKKGAERTVFAGFFGAGLGQILGGTIEGAAIGLAIGEIADRFMNPTAKIRNLLTNELNNFINASKPDLINYSLSTQKQLMEDITNKIIHNYEARVKKAILLLNK